jgi:hypothetical protein
MIGNILRGWGTLPIILIVIIARLITTALLGVILGLSCLLGLEFTKKVISVIEGLRR